MRRNEKALPEMKASLQKAAAATGVKADGFHPKVPLEMRGKIIRMLETVSILTFQ